MLRSLNEEERLQQLLEVFKTDVPLLKF